MKTNKSRKRLCSALLCLILAVSMLPITGYAGEGEIAINETNFPDENFRTHIKKYDTDKNEHFSQTELDAVTLIWYQMENAKDFTGIGHFKKLKKLECYKHKLTTLDLSQNSALEEVGCTSNQLTSLALGANKALKELHCGENKLTSLDVSQNTGLINFTCSRNKLRALTFGKNTALKTLKCSGNELKALDLTALTALTTLECYDNELESLNISGLTKLTEVNCGENLFLQSLDISSNTALENLNCSNMMHQGMLSDLVLGDNGALKSLDCSNNSLTSLELSKLTGLTVLRCGNNDIEALDVSALTKLATLDCSGDSYGWNKGSLRSLIIDQNNKLEDLDCSNNQLTSLDVSGLANLNWLSCDGNEYTIQVGRDGKFDLSNLPTGFDVNRVTQWTNASVEQKDGRNMLKVDDNASEVTYTYNCSGETNGNPKFTATFTLLVEKEQTYAINVENDGNGTASANPVSAAKDEVVTLTAAPNEGYEFKEWQVVSGNITINDNKFTMPANPVTVKAIFEQKKYAVTVQTDGNGTASASVASVEVTSAAKDEVVTLTAAPNEGYELDHWVVTPDNITLTTGSGGTTTFTMPANPVTVKAIFEQKKYAITVQTDGNGTASANPVSAAKDEVVTLTAAPNEGYEFDKWVVADNKVILANPNSPTTTFTMPASEVTVKASFKKKVASGGSSGGGAYVPSTPPAPSNPKPSGSAVTSDVSGSTSRKDGETSTKVDQSTADKLVDAAIDNKSTDIVIDTASKTENGGVPNVKASEVTLPTETIKNIAEKTDASLTIKTDVGEIKLDNKAAASVSKQGENIGAPGEQETNSIIAKKVKEDTEEVRYELEIKNSGGKTISDFRGGTATITVPVPSGLQGESLICVYIDKKGHYNKVKGKWTADGRYAFSTGHFSTYAMMRETTADTVIAKQKAAVRKMTMEVRTKIIKTKSGKQAIRVTWTSGGKIIPDGVQIYRSTKKGGSFGKKPIFTTEKTRYLNTAVKTGQRYYYKVRGYVTIDGETVYTKLSGKDNRKLPETV